MILAGHTDVVAQVVGKAIEGGERGFGDCVGLAVTADDGDMLAGVIFHNWNPESGVVEISAAAWSPRWLNRWVIRKVMGYAFDDLGCQMVVARQAEDNERSLKIWRALGAEMHRIPRLRGRDRAEIIACLTDDAFRAGKFGGQRHGQA